jgi:hypothetical protein
MNFYYAAQRIKLNSDCSIKDQPDLRYPPNSNCSILGGSKTALLLREWRSNAAMMYLHHEQKRI